MYGITKYGLQNDFISVSNDLEIRDDGLLYFINSCIALCFFFEA